MSHYVLFQFLVTMGRRTQFINHRPRKPEHPHRRPQQPLRVLAKLVLVMIPACDEQRIEPMSLLVPSLGISRIAVHARAATTMAVATASAANIRAAEMFVDPTLHFSHDSPETRVNTCI